MKGKIYRFQNNSRYPQLLYILLLLTCCFPFVSASCALLLGLLASVLMGAPFKNLMNKWSGILLKASVIGFGFGIDIHVLVHAGRENIGVTAGFVLGALAIGILLGALLKIDKTIALLISVGTAICGGSAIAAVGSTVKANSDQLSVATGTVFLLNALALFIFPAFGHWLGLSQVQFGHWVAIAIHDTSSVVGASAHYGDEALKVASISKMLRILWIIPVLAVLVIGSSKNRGTLKFPLFIIGFILASCLFSLMPAEQKLFKDLYAIAKQMMVVSLFMIGSGVSVGTVKQVVGGKVLIQAVALWMLITIASLLVIVWL
ncbi:hypothetical protein A8C56_01520 [Niabella ginsenosidivorans]|uniref:Sulfate exporter family transporter n=1 Tax=Niabella ginsenosidivorans TaxID=1176587 RepID=A0A1A9HWR8_9BACT|nr:putative sulfate exporter family transporter [Niabella ginsenosidivorans]ANH79827.1 hypothetical protein A8C56_01520 [Niabella ginsenosidivorans]